jgi:hypothetical protein
VYKSIIGNNNLKILINTILKISNYLNTNTGKKENKTFDIRNLENILNLKNNSQYFIDILAKAYFSNTANNEPIFDSQNSYQLKNVLDINLNLNGLEKEYEKFRLSIKDNYESITQIVRSDVLSLLNETFGYLNGLMDVFLANIKEEKLLRSEFLYYFGFGESKADLELVNQILNSILSLSKKVSNKLKDNTARQIVMKENELNIEVSKEVKLNSLDIKKTSLMNKENKKPLNLINNKYKL